MPVTLLIERWFAEKYHWTPDQVRELPLEAYTWLPVIDRAADAANQTRENNRQRSNINPRLR